jgi:predicted TIM-barrel fold metal-dependent hydrolase
VVWSLDEIPLIDHHCHQIVDAHHQADVETLLRITSEAPAGYHRQDLTDRLVWHAILDVVRRHTGYKAEDEACLADILRQQDYADYCRGLFQDAGYEALYIDTGYQPKGAASLESFADLSGARIRPVLRLERMAEEEWRPGLSFSDWWEAVEHRIEGARASGFIGAKSIAAYRCGLAVRPVSKEEAEVAYDEWMAAKTGRVPIERASDSPEFSQKPLRLTDERLIYYLLWNAAPMLAQQGLPLQFHVGYGDPDTHLLKGNPLLLRDFIETFTPQGLSITLLHTYPYHREAGYLASVYNGVYFDVSLILPLGLSGARRVLCEALELSPYSRFLFASDAHTRPELFALAAEVFRDALHHHLNDPLVMRCTSASTRERWARMVLHDNALQLYVADDGR